MKVLLFKKTTDNDLYKGLKVAYKNKAGEYTLTGIIDNCYTDQDGIKLYQMNVGISFMADELKLIDNSKAVKVIFEDSKYNYTTSVNPEATDESLKKYFIGTTFNVGTYPTELMKKCISIEIL
jgi:hypothetical protein